MSLQYTFWWSVLMFYRLRFVEISCSNTTAIWAGAVGSPINSWWVRNKHHTINFSEETYSPIQAKKERKMTEGNLVLFQWTWSLLQKTSKSTKAIKIGRTEPPFSLHHKNPSGFRQNNTNSACSIRGHVTGHWKIAPVEFTKVNISESTSRSINR